MSVRFRPQIKADSEQQAPHWHVAGAAAPTTKHDSGDTYSRACFASARPSPRMSLASRASSEGSIRSIQ